MDRRDFIRTGLAATGALTMFGSAFWRRALATHPAPGLGTGYGALGAPDANGLRLPPGFAARELARGRALVPGTAYVWHTAADGGATFATPGGGWIYVSNSEVVGAGGAGALRFDPTGAVVDAYRILAGTSANCAGGSTPWGTWLSCEEMDYGLVWECDPTGATPPAPRPALGTFKHEAAVVDPATGFIYMTEDQGEGRFYRFRPGAGPVDHPSLTTGVLEVARVTSTPAGRGLAVAWHTVPNPIAPPGTTPTRFQVLGSTAFNRGEGAWFDDGTVYFCSTGNNTVWAYDCATASIEAVFTSSALPGSPLNGADNITVSPGGDIFVCEDHGPETPLELVLIDPVANQVSAFAEIVGTQHLGSELTGVAFDPSGTRMYVSSQRAFGLGATYEITGPFRTTR